MAGMHQAHKQIYIARHAETEENIAKIVQGWLPGTLSYQGKNQARALGRALQQEGIEYILCGDLENPDGKRGRQRQTADEIRRYITVPAKYTPLLLERGCGSLEGKRYHELGIATDADFPCYGGAGTGVFADMEPFFSVTDRAREAIGWMRRLPHRRILAVGSGWINSYIVNILLDEPWVYHEQDNAAVHYFELDTDGKPVHHELNKDVIRRSAHDAP